MSRPIISIVTVTVQPVSEIIKTLDSLVSQINSVASFEWILIVGKYFDDYKKFLKDYEERLNIKILYQPPRGIYSAMNFGLINSSGHWIWFVNCGDYLMDQDVINTLGVVISENPSIGFIASPVLYVTPQNFWFDISWPRILKVGVKHQAHVHHQGVLVRKSICDKVRGPFDTSLKLAADGKFLDQAVSQTNYLILDSIFCVFVMGGASSKNYSQTLRETSTYRKKETFNLSLMLKNSFREIILNLLNQKGFLIILRPLMQRRSKAVARTIRKANECKFLNTP